MACPTIRCLTMPYHDLIDVTNGDPGGGAAPDVVPGELKARLIISGPSYLSHTLVIQHARLLGLVRRGILRGSAVLVSSQPW